MFSMVLNPRPFTSDYTHIDIEGMRSPSKVWYLFLKGFFTDHVSETFCKLQRVLTIHESVLKGVKILKLTTINIKCTSNRYIMDVVIKYHNIINSVIQS